MKQPQRATNQHCRMEWTIVRLAVLSLQVLWGWKHCDNFLELPFLFHVTSLEGWTGRWHVYVSWFCQFSVYRTAKRLFLTNNLLIFVLGSFRRTIKTRNLPQTPGHRIQLATHAFSNLVVNILTQRLNHWQDVLLYSENGHPGKHIILAQNYAFCFPYFSPNVHRLFFCIFEF